MSDKKCYKKIEATSKKYPEKYDIFLEIGITERE